MYNRYQGNTGRFERMKDPEPVYRKSLPAHGQTSEPANRELVPKRPPPARGGGLGNILPFGAIQNGLGGILSNILPDGLESEDLLLLLILYLMYKESGDRELLIIMGAMFFV